MSNEAFPIQEHSSKIDIFKERIVSPEITPEVLVLVERILNTQIAELTETIKSISPSAVKIEKGQRAPNETNAKLNEIDQGLAKALSELEQLEEMLDILYTAMKENIKKK